MPVFPGPTVCLRQVWGQHITALGSPEIQSLIRAGKTIFISGWAFRAPDFVGRHKEKIRNYFNPIKSHAQASRQVVAGLREQADIVIGVHVRQGDYATWRKGRYLFPTARYAAWMHDLADQFPGSKIAFLVCSNEPRSAKEFPGLTVGFGTGIPVEDLYSLAECDRIIGPVSSFSQWASFYGEKPLLFLTNANTPIKREQFRISMLGEVPD